MEVVYKCATYLRMVFSCALNVNMFLLLYCFGLMHAPCRFALFFNVGLDLSSLSFLPFSQFATGPRTLHQQVLTSLQYSLHPLCVLRFVHIFAAENRRIAALEVYMQF